MTLALFYTELYEFTFLDKAFYYTSTKADIIYNGKTYKSIVIKRNRIKNKIFDETTINTYLKYEPFNIYLLGMPFIPIKCNIKLYIKSLEGTKVIPIFEGYITGYTIAKDKQIQLNLKSKLLLLNKKIPNQFYTTNCRFELFDKHCKVDINETDNDGNYLYKIVGKKLSDLHIINNYIIYDRDLKSNNPVKFLYGNVVFKQDGQIITKNFIIGYDNIEGSIKILNPIYKDICIKNGYNFDVEFWVGCQKTLEYCRRFFNNEINFGGFPDIPQSNPALTQFNENNLPTSI